MENTNKEEKKKKKGFLPFKLGRKSKDAFIKTSSRKRRGGFIPFLFGRGAGGIGKIGTGGIAKLGTSQTGLGWFLSGIKNVLFSGKMIAAGLVKSVFTTAGGALMAGLAVTALGVGTGLYLNSTKEFKPDYYMGSGFNKTVFDGAKTVAKKPDNQSLDWLVNLNNRKKLNTETEDLAKFTDIDADGSLTGETTLAFSQNNKGKTPKPKLEPESYLNQNLAMNLGTLDNYSKNEDSANIKEFKPDVPSEVIGSMDIPPSRVGRLQVMAGTKARQTGTSYRVAAALSPTVYSGARQIAKSIVSATTGNTADIVRGKADTSWSGTQTKGSEGIPVSPSEVPGGSGGGGGNYPPGGGGGDDNDDNDDDDNDDYDPFFYGGGSTEDYYIDGDDDGIDRNPEEDENMFPVVLSTHKTDSSITVLEAVLYAIVFVVTLGLVNKFRKAKDDVKDAGRGLLFTSAVLGLDGYGKAASEVKDWGKKLISASQVKNSQFKGEVEKTQEHIERRRVELGEELTADMQQANEPVQEQLKKTDVYKDFLDKK